MILFIVAIAAFLGDFGSGAGIPCIVIQGEEWNMSPNAVNYAGNLNVVMLYVFCPFPPFPDPSPANTTSHSGVGGLIWIPLIYTWGRAPVLFWTTLSGTFFTLACAVAQDFTTFYAFRALMGLTLTACQVIGLSFIKDMFFFHEHARKINLWAGLFLLSPYMGPLLGNFIIDGTGEWRPVFWLVFAICCFEMVLIVLFADETWYRRDVPVEQHPPRGNRIMRLIGVWQVQNHSYFYTAARSMNRYVQVLFKPIMIPIMVY